MQPDGGDHVVAFGSTCTTKRNQQRTVVFIHVCTINTWETILESLLLDLQVSGLLDIVETVTCSFVGNVPQQLPDFLKHDKVQVVHCGTSIQSFERPTLLALQKFATANSDYRILYLHTKGVTRSSNPALAARVRDWVSVMIYFLVYKFREALHALSVHDVVGVNFLKSDVHPAHFSGNFWWSKSAHLRHLACEIGHKYNDPELWVMSKQGHGTVCAELFRTGVNHYHVRFPPDLYVATVTSTRTHVVNCV